MDFSSHVVLENSRARLRPLELADFEALKPVAFDPELWKYTLTAAHTPMELADYLQQALQGREQGKRYPFVIIDKLTGQVAGSTSYYNVDPAEQRLSIGYTWVGKDFQRSGLNRACKHLLLSHAFGPLGCERVELETTPATGSRARPWPAWAPPRKAPCAATATPRAVSGAIPSFSAF
jgi:RimJ/RimL family protein N-acetyltransferase